MAGWLGQQRARELPLKDAFAEPCPSRDDRRVVSAGASLRLSRQPPGFTFDQALCSPLQSVLTCCPSWSSRYRARSSAICASMSRIFGWAGP